MESITLLNIEKNPVGPVDINYTDDRSLQSEKHKCVQVFKGVPVTGLPKCVLDSDDLKSAESKGRIKIVLVKNDSSQKKNVHDKNNQSQVGSGVSGDTGRGNSSESGKGKTKDSKRKLAVQGKAASARKKN